MGATAGWSLWNSGRLGQNQMSRIKARVCLVDSALCRMPRGMRIKTEQLASGDHTVTEPRLASSKNQPCGVLWGGRPPGDGSPGRTRGKAGRGLRAPEGWGAEPHLHPLPPVPPGVVAAAWGAHTRWAPHRQAHSPDPRNLGGPKADETHTLSLLTETPGSRLTEPLLHAAPRTARQGEGVTG